MRSRYSAYVLQLADYLLVTWAPETRPSSLDFDDEAQHPIKWLGLNVLSSKEEGSHGEVRFIARYKLNGRAERLQEHSRFVKLEDGRWYYVNGVGFEV